MKHPSNAELTTAAAAIQIFFMNPILMKYYFQIFVIFLQQLGDNSRLSVAPTNRMIIKYLIMTLFISLSQAVHVQPDLRMYHFSNYWVLSAILFCRNKI